jgi:Ran GTPase-activating protein (RanGAP) involved in mRNA processing and transport
MFKKNDFMNNVAELLKAGNSSSKMKEISVYPQGGFGYESAKVLSSILKSSPTFSVLDLRKNSLGGDKETMRSFIKGIRFNKSLVHLDLGSNELGPEAAFILFDLLHKHPTLTSISLANQDGIHRNR